MMHKGENEIELGALLRAREQAIKGSHIPRQDANVLSIHYAWQCVSPLPSSEVVSYHVLDLIMTKSAHRLRARRRPGAPFCSAQLGATIFP